MDAFHTYIDHYIYGYLELESLPTSKLFLTYHKIPFNQRIKFADGTKRILEVYRFPLHYRHFSNKETRYYIAGYVSFWALAFYWKLFKNIRRANFIFAGFWGLLSFPFLVGSHYALERIRDVKSVYCIDGKTILMQTFQDGEHTYEFDLADLRIVTGDDLNSELVCLVDSERLKKIKPIYYCIRVIPENIPNMHVFEKLLIEQNYLRYL